MSQSDVDVDKKFIDMGLDSIIGVEWIKAVNKQYGTSIQATKVYDYPTIREFAGFLADEFYKQGGKIHNSSVILVPKPSIALPTTELTTVSEALAPETIKIQVQVNQSSYISSEALQEELVVSMAEVLYMRLSDVDVDKKFVDMGLDSILAVEWIKAVNKQYGISIPATKAYDYPSIREFAKFLKEELKATSTVSLDEVLQQVHQGSLNLGQAHELLQPLYLKEE